LSCLLEEEVEKNIREFHKGDCGGHHYWKTIVHKILRVGFYWPSIFSDVYKEVSSAHECQIFYGKRKLQTLPLKPISVEAPFRQWGLDFIVEICPRSSTQHKWILTTTNYFTKWNEAVPTKQAMDIFIIQFLENNILSRFGCPIKIITDNATAFKSKKMENICSDYNITLSHSTSYYPQGNGLVELSNKSLTRIIKTLLQDNKMAWHKKLIQALWVNRITTKRSIATSPF
jgi:transposase InsO family protein